MALPHSENRGFTETKNHVVENVPGAHPARCPSSSRIQRRFAEVNEVATRPDVALWRFRQPGHIVVVTLLPGYLHVPLRVLPYK